MNQSAEEDPVPLDYAPPPRRRGLRGCIWAGALLLALPILLFLTALVTMAFFPEPPNIDERPEYAGRTLEAVTRDLGQPTFSRQMTVAESWDLPFRGNFVGKAYSPADADQAKVQVRELSWKRRRTYVTVWFHQVDGRWVGIDGVEWHKRMLNFARLQPQPAERIAASRPAGTGG